MKHMQKIFTIPSLTVTLLLLAPSAVFAVSAEDLIGTWTMIREETFVGESVGKTKVIEFTAAGTVIEDYSQLTGYNYSETDLGQTNPLPLDSGCTPAGTIVSPFSVSDENLEVQADAADVQVTPYVSCVGGGTGQAGTNAVPLPFYYSGAQSTGIATWAINLDANQLTLTTVLGPNTVTQIYQGGGVIGSSPSAPPSGTPPPDDGGGTRRIQPVLEADIQEEALAAFEANPIPIPPDYSPVTESVVDLTTDQQERLADQLTSDIEEQTSLEFAGNGWGSQLSNEVGAITITRVREIGIRPQNESADIRLTGYVNRMHDNLPEGLTDMEHAVIVTLFSNPVVRIAQADVNGKWTLTVPAELFDAGDHVAFAAAEVNGVRSDQVEITKFIIEEEQRLSGTTWLVIINGAVAAVVLIVLIVVQLERRKKIAAN